MPQRKEYPRRGRTPKQHIDDLFRDEFFYQDIATTLELVSAWQQDPGLVFSAPDLSPAEFESVFICVGCLCMFVGVTRHQCEDIFFSRTCVFDRVGQVGPQAAGGRSLPCQPRDILEYHALPSWGTPCCR